MPSFVGVLSNRLFQIDGLVLKQVRELHFVAPQKFVRRAVQALYMRMPGVGLVHRQEAFLTEMCIFIQPKETWN